MISLTIVSATFAKIGSGTSKGIVLPKGIAILARRHLDNLDSPSVALAYARQRYALDIIAQIDFHLELAIQEAEEAEEMDVVMNASILADYRSRIGENGRRAGRLCIELYCGKGTPFEREQLTRYPFLLEPED